MMREKCELAPKGRAFMKYRLTRDELNKLTFYMTLQRYKKVKTWLGTAILAFVLRNIFSGDGGFFVWMFYDLILLLLYFWLTRCLYVEMNKKATDSVELILENGRVRMVSEEGEYGVSFRAGEISRKVCFRGLLILVRECWCGEGKNRICVGTVYYGNYVSSYLKGITDAWEVRWAAQINKTPQPNEIIDARVDVLGHTYPTLKQHLDAMEVNSVEAEVDTQHYGDRTTSWANLKVLDLSSTSTSLSYRSVGTVNAILPQLGYAECFIDDLQTQTA